MVRESLRGPAWRRAAGAAARAAAVAVFFTAWWAAYGLTNRYGCAPGRGVYFARPIDASPALFQPWTAVVYVAGGLALPLAPFRYYWTWPRLRFVLACYGLASAVAFTCYALWPVRIVRPSYEGDGLGRWLMRQVASVDETANCTPSSHAVFAVLAALLIGRAAAGRGVRVVVWCLAAAVCASTITTGQHYFIDVVSGAALAAAAYAVCRRLWPEGASRPAGPNLISIKQGP